MDGNNWRCGVGQVPMAQSQAGNVEQIALSSSGGAQPMDADDWRGQLPLAYRQRILNKIMETLKKHLPFSGQEGLQELKKIAVRFEEKIYSAATSQPDYLRKISLKMLTMEMKAQNPMAANSMQPGSVQPGAANASRNPSDLASHSMQSQTHNPGLAMPRVGSQPQGRQQLIPQNLQNHVSAGGMQNHVAQNSNLQTMQNNSNGAQNSVMGQWMQGRQQQVLQQQQHYNQQLQQQLMQLHL